MKLLILLFTAMACAGFSPREDLTDEERKIFCEMFVKDNSEQGRAQWFEFRCDDFRKEEIPSARE